MFRHDRKCLITRMFRFNLIVQLSLKFREPDRISLIFALNILR